MGQDQLGQKLRKCHHLGPRYDFFTKKISDLLSSRQSNICLALWYRKWQFVFLVKFCLVWKVVNYIIYRYRYTDTQENFQMLWTSLLLKTEKTLKYLGNSISRVACNMVTWLKNQLLSSRKGMKATVVLFFFLGMSSLLFCINPKDEGIYEDAYMVTNAILKVT